MVHSQRITPRQLFPPNLLGGEMTLNGGAEAPEDEWKGTAGGRRRKASGRARLLAELKQVREPGLKGPNC